MGLQRGDVLSGVYCVDVGLGLALDLTTCGVTCISLSDVLLVESVSLLLCDWSLLGFL